MTETVNQPTHTLLSKLAQAVDAIWQIEQYCVGPDGAPRSYPLFDLLGPLATQPEIGADFLSASFDVLLEDADYNETEVSRRAALLYARPGGWFERYRWDYALPENERYVNMARGEIIQTVLSSWIKLHPTLATVSLLSERLETLLQGEGAKWRPDLFPPTLSDGLDILVGDPSPTSTNVLQQVVAGALGRARPGSVEEPELRRRTASIYLRLWQEKSLDYAVFRQALFALPGVFNDLGRPLDRVPPPDFYRDLPADFALVLQNYYLTLTTELAERLTQDDASAAALLKQVGELRGANWLLLACAYVEQKKLTRLPASNRWRTSKLLASAVVPLCQTFYQLGDAPNLEDDQQTLAFLKHYQPATLLAVLPYTREGYQDLILEALGWSAARDLVLMLSNQYPPDDRAIAAARTLDAASLTAILQAYRQNYPGRKRLFERVETALALPSNPAL